MATSPAFTRSFGLATTALCCAIVSGCARDDWRFRGRDAAVDVGEERVEVGVDAPLDVGTDGSLDVASEAPRDVGAELVDVARDLGADLPADAPREVGVDAPADGVLEAAVSCAPGEMLCTGACVNVQSDINHCGRCRALCRAGDSCVRGTCQRATAPTCGGAPCSGLCVGERCASPLELVVGGAHACVRFTTRRTHCWGANASGQLGRGTFEVFSPMPAQVNAPMSVSPLENLEALAAGSAHSCAATDVSAAGGMSNVFCWGSNTARQLGQADGVAMASRPLPVSTLSLVTRIAVGEGHSCALNNLPGAPVVVCWGRNSEGQCGLGMPTSSPVATPTAIQRSTLPAGAIEWRGVTAGARHTCAWTSNVIYCWGDDAQRALGRSADGTNATPGAVTATGAMIRSVAAGDGFTCAWVTGRTGEEVFCWGSNAEGRTGIGLITGTCAPTRVAMIPAPQALAVGRAHACILAAEGVPYCWGHNSHGQVGVGAAGVVATPTQLSTELRFSAIAAGGNTTCGLTLGSDPAVYCWGDNASGQLGAPSPPVSATPLRVTF